MKILKLIILQIGNKIPNMAIDRSILDGKQNELTTKIMALAKSVFDIYRQLVN